MNRSSRDIQHTFQSALEFTTLLLSRLDADPVSVDPILWPIKNWESLLWALQQQYLEGPCESSRANTNYAELLRESGSSPLRRCWFGCMADSPLRKWENLGTMKKSNAAAKYISILDRICPGWDLPPTIETTLPVPWMPDSASPCCVICHEGFTLLNRKHHCRRCFQLVCAPCSSVRVGIRLSPGTPIRVHRVCKRCVSTMQKQLRLKSSVTQAVPPKTLPNETVEAAAATTPPSAIVPISGIGKKRAATLRTFGRRRSPSLTTVAEGAPSTASSGESTTETPFKNLTPPSTLVNPLKNAIKRGNLEFLAGPKYRRTWHSVHVIILTRKGLIAIYDQEGDDEPMEIFQLKGCVIRMKGLVKSKHVFKIKDSSSHKSVLTLAASSDRDLTEWVTTTANAVRIANENS